MSLLLVFLKIFRIKGLGDALNALVQLLVEKGDQDLVEQGFVVPDALQSSDIIKGLTGVEIADADGLESGERAVGVVE